MSHARGSAERAPGRWAAVARGLGLGLVLAGGQAQGLGSQAAPQPSSASPLPPVHPVGAVDLNRYAGGWYEIARIPNRFQIQCARHSTAHYRLRPDGNVAVLNQCIKRNGNVDEARGVARVMDRVSNARLKVSLVSFLGWRPFWGDYWVIGLDPQYRWAVVGSPDRRYGWLLARSPQLAPADLAAAREAVERNGYAWGRFQLGDTRR